MSKQVTAGGSLHIEPLEERQLLTTLGTMNVIDAGTGPSAIISYTVNGVADFADAGVYKWTRSAASPGTYAGKPVAGENFDTFCLEPDQEFPSAPNIPYSVVDLESAPPQASVRGQMGAAKANQVRELWGRFRSAVGTDGAKAAAFQLALWEIVTDTGKNLTSGAFRAVTSSAADVAIKNQAQAWLDQVNGAGPKANLLALSSPCDQDQIFEIPPPPVVPPCKPVDCTPHKPDCKPPTKNCKPKKHHCKPAKPECKPVKHDCKPKKQNCKPKHHDDHKKDCKVDKSNHDNKNCKKPSKSSHCKSGSILQKIKGHFCR